MIHKHRRFKEWFKVFITIYQTQAFEYIASMDRCRQSTNSPD